MKAFKITFAIELAVIAVLTAIFFGQMEIGLSSICPAFLIFLSFIQGITFAFAARDLSPFETAYSENNELTREEYGRLCRIHAGTKFLAIPLFAFFALFFSSLWKFVVPLLIYFLSFVIAKLVFVYGPKSIGEQNTSL